MTDKPIVTPGMLAVAWAAWRVRHPHLRLGPGPAFREAIEAALAHPDAAAILSSRVERLEQQPGAD